LGKRGNGKAEKGNGYVNRGKGNEYVNRGMNMLTGERGKGKAERAVHSCLLVFHFSTNHEIRPVFMFFTGWPHFMRVWPILPVFEF
jgi:hypothetical protein